MCDEVNNPEDFIGKRAKVTIPKEDQFDTQKKDQMKFSDGPTFAKRNPGEPIVIELEVDNVSPQMFMMLAGGPKQAVEILLAQNKQLLINVDNLEKARKIDAKTIDEIQAAQNDALCRLKDAIKRNNYLNNELDERNVIVYKQKQTIKQLEENSLVNSFADLQKRIHDMAVEKGWWELQIVEGWEQAFNGEWFKVQHGVKVQRSFGDLIALVHSELSEALEAYRDRGTDKWYAEHMAEGVKTVGYGWQGYTVNGESVSADEYSKAIEKKPEGAFVELADAIIRILDIAGYHNVNMFELIEEKIQYNSTRPHRHGGKKL